MTRLDLTAAGWAGRVGVAAGGLRTLWQDLNPGAGAPLAPLPGQRVKWLAWLPHLLVVAVAVALGTVAGGAVATDAGVPGRLALTLGLAQGLPLVVALYRPMTGFWLSLIAGITVSEVIRAGGAGSVWAEPSLLTHLGVLGLVGLQARPQVLAELWLLTLGAGAILVQRMPGLNASPDLAEMTTLSAIVLVAAGALAGRRETQRRLAEQERISDAERTRRTLLEERTRIARELHDVVAHHMSVIAIQAEAAPYRVPDPPEELARSFATIRTTASEGLHELRRLVGVLRADGTDGAADDAGPQPTLDQLGELVATVEQAGTTVTMAVEGTPRPLPPGVELSAYRILQEALSNALRHAPGSQVQVELGYRPARLDLRVVNGPARSAPIPSPGAGHGVLGMKERAAMLGGELTAEPRPDGGFAVTAVLPLPDGQDDMSVRVLVADDQALIREGLLVLLRAQEGIEVVGEAVDGRDAVDKAAALRPDVVLMDVRMPVLNGLEATRRILGDQGNADDSGSGATKVLVVTTFDLDEYVYEALRAGASGFLLKDSSAQMLAEAVRVVAAGDAMLSPPVTRRLLGTFARLGGPRGPTRDQVDRLTERETEVLTLVARGCSNAEIADELVLAEQTIKTHVSRILTKLDLRDRTQAAIFAYETGLVRPDNQ